MRVIHIFLYISYSYTIWGLNFDGEGLEYLTKLLRFILIG